MDWYRLPIFAAPFLGLPVPLLPIQILWINLVTDGLPGLALAMEPAERDVMRRAPRRPAESLFAHGPLLGAVLVTVALQLAVVYLPVGNALFGTVPLGAAELGACVAAALAVLAIVETEKSFRRRAAPRG